MPRNFAIESCVSFVRDLLTQLSDGQRRPATPAEESPPCEPEEQLAPASQPAPSISPALTLPPQRLKPVGVPASDVFAAVIAAVQSAGRPLPINRIAQILEEKHTWPPAGLADMMAQREREAGRRDVSATAISATTLARPSPALVKAFVLSRLAALGGGVSCTRQATSSSALPNPQAEDAAKLHVEISTRIIAECLCLGGAGCSRGMVAACEPAAVGSSAGRYAAAAGHPGHTATDTVHRAAASSNGSAAPATAGRAYRPSSSIGALSADAGRGIGGAVARPSSRYDGDDDDNSGGDDDYGLYEQFEARGRPGGGRKGRRR